MKRISLIIFQLSLITGLIAQQTKPDAKKGIHYPNGVYYLECRDFKITRPFREIAEEQHFQNKYENTEPREADKPRRITAKGSPQGIPQGEDPNVQRMAGTRSLTPPGLNFDGQSGNSQPLDPSGAVGLTAYVQSINTSFQAFNKTTGAPLMSSMNLSSILPSANCDAVVMYDKYADRWFIGMLSNASADVIIAVSKTNDPTGQYYQYTFTPDGQSVDYPKWSIWQDGYYMGTNLNTVKLTVFDRSKMLAGNTSAGMVVLPTPSTLPTSGFYCPLPADADGVLPAAGTPNYFFAFEDDNWGTPAVKDQIHILKMTTDWASPANSKVVEDTAMAVPAFNSFWSNYGTEITQKGGGTGIDAIQGVFMYRAQFRKWTGYNTVVLSNAVNVGTNGQSGIRWYELRQDQAKMKWKLYQQGTFAPDAENRWMSSIAMDAHGNIGMAYCVSGTNEYPSLRYTGRYPGDPLGQLTFTEQTAVAGSSASGGNRWGDYSQTSIDPSDDLTFWHTGMYGGGRAGATRIFNFKITPSVITGIEESKLNGPQCKAYLTSPENLFLTASNLPNDDELQVDLFDLEGKLIHARKAIPASGILEMNISTNGLAKGLYLLRVGNLSFQRVIKIAL
jgi:hypothetical protein